MKLYEVKALAHETQSRIRQDLNAWNDFLEHASRVYRYRFMDQILIYAQRPDAVACATMNIWNSKMGCWIKKGNRGIALIDESNSRKLKYVWDVASVVPKMGGHLPRLWVRKPYHTETIQNRLVKVYVLVQVGIRLVKEKTLISDTQLKRPEQVVGFVSDILREYDREVMCVICLNAKLNPVNMCICSMGAVDKAIASPREIMKTAILSNANGFIILHNHPGGSSQPSLEDIHVTDVMSKAGELLGIPLYDHIIAAAGSDEIYSFYEKGSMPQSQLKYADRVADINLRSDMAETNEIRKPLKLHQIKI